MPGLTRAAVAGAAVLAVLLTGLAGCSATEPSDQGAASAEARSTESEAAPEETTPTPDAGPQTLADVLRATAESGRTASFTYHMDLYTDDGEGNAGWQEDGLLTGLPVECQGITDFVAAEQGGCVFTEEWTNPVGDVSRAGDPALTGWVTTGDSTMVRVAGGEPWRVYDPQPGVDEPADLLEYLSPLQIRLQLSPYLHETGPVEGLVDWGTHSLVERGNDVDAVLLAAADRGVTADSLEDLVAQVEGNVDENGYRYTLTDDGLLKTLTLREVARSGDSGAAYGTGYRLKFRYTDEPVTVTLPEEGTTDNLPTSGNPS